MHRAAGSVSQQLPSHFSSSCLLKGCALIFIHWSLSWAFTESQQGGMKPWTITNSSVAKLECYYCSGHLSTSLCVAECICMIKVSFREDLFRYTNNGRRAPPGGGVCCALLSIRKCGLTSHIIKLRLMIKMYRHGKSSLKSLYSRIYGY